MTYLLPDDWYANHGLAPGDARGRQPILQPRPGNEVTSPIMRGYYGRPPIAMLKTRAVALRPFMDTDVMWGVNGLHGMPPRGLLSGLGGQETIQQVMSRLKKDLKADAIKQAAAGTAIAVGLNAIPIVGIALSAVFSAIQAIGGAHYQNEVKEVMADAQNKAKVIQSEYEIKYEAAQNAVFEQELAAGMTIASTCQGMHGLGDFWSKAKDVISKVTSPVTTTIRRVGAEVRRVDSRIGAEAKREVEDITGASALNDAQAARDKMLIKLRADLEAQYQQAVANMDSLDFRTQLRGILASKILDDSAASQLIRAQCGLAPGQELPGASMVASMPGVVKGGAFAAVGVTAAMIAFIALGGGHH